MFVNLTHKFLCFIAVFFSVFSTYVYSEEIVSPSQKIENYEHWALMCNNVSKIDQTDTETEARFCEIKTTVSIKNEDGNAVPIININVGQLPNSEDFLMLFQVPSDVFLRSTINLGLKDPSQESVEIIAEGTYFRCQQSGCLADTKLPEAIIDKLSSSNNAIAYFVDGNKRTIGIPVSLLGFKNSLIALQNK